MGRTSRFIAGVLSSTLLLLTCSGSPAEAQAPTIHLRSDVLPHVGMTNAVEVQWKKPLKEIDLSNPGTAQDAVVSNWLLKASVRVGYLWDWHQGRQPDGSFTTGGQIGISHRRLAKVKEVGLHAAVQVHPFAVGPAVDARILVIDLHAGTLWVKQVDGFCWFVGVGVPTALIRDLFK